MTNEYLLKILLEKMERIEEENRLMKMEIDRLSHKIERMTMTSSFVKEDSVKGKAERLLDYLKQHTNADNLCKLSYKKLLHILKLPEDTDLEEFNERYARCIRYLNRNTGFYCSSQDVEGNLKKDSDIEFAQKRNNGQKMSIIEIKRYLEDKIAESDEEYIVINAYKIQFEMGIKDRVQMVGKAMYSIYDPEKGDTILEGETKDGLFTSKYTISYKRR